MEELEPVKPALSAILVDHWILIVADLLNVAKYLCRICDTYKTCLVYLSFRMQGPKFTSIVYSYAVLDHYKPEVNIVQ